MASGADAAGHSFQGNIARESARQHNGNVYGDVYNSRKPSLWNWKHHTNECDHLDVVALQRERSYFSNLTQEQRNRRLLETAAEGQYRRLELLIHADADLDYKDNNGETALHKAAWRGYQDCVELILLGGAHVNAQDAKGRTALYIASKMNQYKICHLLIGHRAHVDTSTSTGFSVSALRVAAREGNVSIVKLLLDHEKIDAASTNGETALMQAAGQGHEAVVKLLLEQGANIMAKDNNGVTALTWALSGEHNAVVQLLLAAKWTAAISNIKYEQPFECSHHSRDLLTW